jgi:uncharacterized membrane protein YkvA (DUF1232 family)
MAAGRERATPNSEPRIRRRRIASSDLVRTAILQIPAFVRLLYGLMRDRKVAFIHKVLVAAAIAYVAMPADMVADFIPFLGLVDDVFVVAATVRHMIANAGMRRVMRHWHGKPADLRRLRVDEIIEAAARFLPRRVRKRLAARGLASM